MHPHVIGIKKAFVLICNKQHHHVISALLDNTAHRQMTLLLSPILNWLTSLLWEYVQENVKQTQVFFITDDFNAEQISPKTPLISLSCSLIFLNYSTDCFYRSMTVSVWTRPHKMDVPYETRTDSAAGVNVRLLGPASHSGILVTAYDNERTLWDIYTSNIYGRYLFHLCIISGGFTWLRYARVTCHIQMSMRYNSWQSPFWNYSMNELLYVSFI